MFKGNPGNTSHRGGKDDGETGASFLFLSSLFSLFLDKADQRNLTALGHAVTWGQVSWAEGAIMFDKSFSLHECFFRFFDVKEKTKIR